MDQHIVDPAAPPLPALTPLDPAYRWQIAVHAAIFALLLTVAASIATAILRANAPGWSIALVWVPVIVLLVLLLSLPQRRYRSWGYALEPLRLRLVRGYFVRIETEVPFGRVQHIDVTRGPIERALGLGTLVLHTAGSHNATVALPGLAAADAERMRDTIRARTPAAASP